MTQKIEITGTVINESAPPGGKDIPVATGDTVQVKRMVKGNVVVTPDKDDTYDVVVQVNVIVPVDFPAMGLKAGDVVQDWNDHHKALSLKAGVAKAITTWYQQTIPCEFLLGSKIQVVALLKTVGSNKVPSTVIAASPAFEWYIGAAA